MHGMGSICTQHVRQEYILPNAQNGTTSVFLWAILVFTTLETPD